MTRMPSRDREGALRLKLVLSAALVGYLLLTTGSILTRLPWVDEGIFASPAYNLISKGYMGTTAMETAGTPWQGIERHTYWTVPLHILAQAGWYELFGFGLFSMRALSALWGLAALAALYSIALRLSGDRAVATLAAALIALDCSFIATASSGRMDMMNAGLGIGGLAAYLGLRKRHLLIAVLAGHSLVCASGLTHPNGILYFVSLLFLMIYFDHGRISWRDWALAAVPYCVGALGWGLYIREEPGSFLSQFTGNMRNGGRLSYLRAPWAGVWNDLVVRYLGYFGLAPGSTALSRLKLIIPLVHAAGLAGLLSMAALRRQPGYRALLGVAALQFGMLAVYDGQKLPYYLIHTVPLLDAILAVWVVSVWTKNSIPRPLLGALLAAFLAVQILTTVQRIRQNPYRTSYLPAVSFLQTNAGHPALIMGSSALDFGLGFDGAAIDDPRLGYNSGKSPDFIVVGDVDYAEYFRGYQTGEPAVYRFIVERLAKEYKLVYNQAGETIYARR
jgi:4-amino-4-deoxy-L-arabinose transferase-like glycosyltransferase